MPEAGELVETGARKQAREQELTRISAALHDLCQPLTTLQCRLEMAQLLDTPQACREAVEAGMRECLRLSAAVVLMREAVRDAMRPMGGDADIGATG